MIKPRKLATTRRARGAGMTLVELVITIAIVAFTAIAIIGSLSAGALYQQSLRERNGASRAAATIMESTKKQFFGNLREQDIDDVLIDDRGTARVGDDVVGTATLRFFTTDGTNTPIGTIAAPIPLNRSMIRVVVQVRWQPAGRPRAVEREITLSSLLAP